MGEADGPGALSSLSRRRDPTKSLFMASGEDANPLNRRLPAEVVSRRRRPEKRVKEEEPAEDIQVDLKVVLSLKPEARPKWLGKAFRAAEDGRASTYDLYNIVTSRKFVAGLPHKVGKKLASIVREHVRLFSDKQKRYLRSEECLLMSNFTINEAKGADGGSDDEKVDAATRMEEMMARCRAFVREKADTFGERITEAQDRERKAQEEAALTYERNRFEAEDQRTRQRAREAEERVQKEAAEAEEQARREAIEREHRQRRMDAEAAEMKKRMATEEQIRKRQLEDEVDSSLMFLERLRRDPTPEPQRETLASAAPSTSTSAVQRSQRRGLSRSRSISVVASRRKRGRSSHSNSRGGNKKGHTQKSRARSKASRSRSRSKRRSKSRSRNRSASRSRQRKRRASSSSSSHHRRKKKEEKSKKRRKSSSSSSDSGKKEEHSKALQRRMKQWESEEKLQRNLWGWATS